MTYLQSASIPTLHRNRRMDECALFPRSWNTRSCLKMARPAPGEKSPGCNFGVYCQLTTELCDYNIVNIAPCARSILYRMETGGRLAFL